MRHLLASRKATITMEYAILGAVVIVVIMTAFEVFGTALEFNLQRTACHIGGGTWQEPAGPCT